MVAKRKIRSWAVSVTMGLGLAIQGTAAQKPNILFLLTDDQRGSTVHDSESKRVATPNLDRLAASGVSFSSCYLFGANNGAVCKPSRAQLMTGQTFFRLPEVVTAGWAPLPKGQEDPLQFPTFPELLKKAGYRTFATGKQHNGKVWVEKGFDEAKAVFLGGMGSHYKLRLSDYSSESGWKSAPSKGVWSSEVFANAAIDFIKAQKGDQPFFAYVAFTAPHDPRTAPKEYHTKYPAEKMTMPENFMPEHRFPIGSMRIRDEKLAPFPRTEKVVRRHLGDYYAMIEATDHHMGRILQSLKDSGHEKNTVVVFSSDNGLAVGQHGLMGKQNVYEHSIRLPMIVKGPGLDQGEKSEAMIYLHDIAPTLLVVAGIKPPQGMHGQSFWSQALDPEIKGREVIYSAYDSWRWERGPIKVEGSGRKFQHRGHGRSFRKGDYKLIIYHMHSRNTYLLFDLKKDPMEIQNLATQAEMRPLLDEMKMGLIKEMKKAGDRARLDVAGWGYPEDRSR